MILTTSRGILLPLLCLVATGGSAQSRVRRTAVQKDTVSAFVRAYSDSIDAIRARIDSSRLELDEADGRFARLFLPPTFYHDVASRRFSVKADTAHGVEEAIDDALLHVYLSRPGLLAGSDDRLRKAGSLREVGERPVRQEVRLAERVDPLPEEVYMPMPGEGLVVQKPNFWEYSGDGYLQFLQNFISGNWYKGGESNYSMVGSLTLNANYNKK